MQPDQRLRTVIVFSLLFNAIMQVHYKPALPYIILEVITMSNDVAFGISVSSDPLSLLQSYEEGFFLPSALWSIVLNK